MRANAKKQGGTRFGISRPVSRKKAARRAPEREAARPGVCFEQVSLPVVHCVFGKSLQIVDLQHGAVVQHGSA